MLVRVTSNTVVQKQLANMNMSTQVSFFCDPHKHWNNPIAGAVWHVACLRLRERLEQKHLHRTLLEVAMFAYMLVTKSVMGILRCRQIKTGAKVVSVRSHQMPAL